MMRDLVSRFKTLSKSLLTLIGRHRETTVTNSQTGNTDRQASDNKEVTDAEKGLSFITKSLPFQSFMRFLGLIKDHAHRGKLFPMSLCTHSVLLAAGLLAALTISQAISSSLFNSYRDALTNASVVCRYLTDYGSSSHFNCDGSVASYAGSDNRGQDDGSPSKGGEKKTGTETAGINKIRLSTKDLASLMIAAGIEEQEDLAVPDTLLLLDKSGPGGWIATGILSTESPSGDHLDSVMLAGDTKACPNTEQSERELFGSIYSLIAIYRTLGKKDDKFNNPCQDELRKIQHVAGILIKNVTGDAPKFWYPFQDNSAKLESDAIKSAMRVPWGHYMTEVIFHSPDDKNCEKDSRKLPRHIIQQKTTSNDLDIFYVADGSFCILETLWYRHDPTKLYQAMFAFSKFMLNEVFRNSKVKQKRFLYQAWRGPIQFCLLVISFYLLFVLIWRFAASLMQRSADHVHLFHKPILVQSVIYDREQQSIDSRAYVDLIISTLPLIGLFGTVIGILFGLPDAAAAVTAVGPSATDAVNALFENLGLAFSTTAIAVLAVVFLEISWLIQQRFEEQSISDYLDKQGGSTK